MSDWTDVGDSDWSDVGWEDVAPSKTFIGELGKGIKAVPSVMADMAMAVPRIGSQIALTTVAKAASPKHSIDELWKASGETINQYVPTVGEITQSTDSPSYSVPMYPFEKYGEAIDWAADKVPNKDVAGTLKMAGALAPIPFAGKAARRVGKAVEAVDPGLRNAEYKKPASKIDALELDRQEVPMEQMELPLETPLQRGAEVLADDAGQMDLFGPVNTAKQRVPGVSPEKAPEPVATKEQGALPFETSPEAIAMRKYLEDNPELQMDMFLEDTKRRQDYDAFREKQNSEGQLEFNRVKDEVVKQLEIEQAHKNKALQEDVNSLRAKFGKEPQVPRGQRGAINLDVFEDGFQRIKVMPNGMRLVMKGTGDSAVVTAMKNGQEVGKMRLEPKDYVSMSPDSDAAAGWVHVVPESRGQGIPEAMYRFAADMGNDIVASKNQLGPGKKMWERFEKTGVSQGMRIPRSQRGAIDFGNDSVKKVASLNKNSPETQKAAGEMEVDRKRAATSGIIPGLEPYRPTMNTPEKVVAAAPSAKDLTPVQKFTASTIKPGIRKVRIATNNPLVNFVGEMTAKVFTEAENYARKYITNKDGIGPLLTKLDKKELVEVHQALMAADKAQKVLTPEQLRKAGFSEKQVEFMNKFYEMEKVKLDVWNEKRLEVGLNPVRERIGHFPGIFSGDYKSLVLDKDGKPIGFIGTDTRHGYKKVTEQIKKQYPGSTITEMKRSNLGGSTPKTDLFSGMQDLLDVLAKNDPRIAEVMQAVDVANANAADSLYNANKHALEKKGIWGNEGNKPWQKDSVEAARDAFKGYFRYWEEGMLSHLNLPVESQIKGLLNNPALDNMPRAKEYVNKYIMHMTGRNLGDVGMALNTLLDAPSRMLGLGPSVTRESVNQLNKRLGQQTMGWFNMPFLATQWLQLGQTFMPEFVTLGNRVGKGVGDSSGALNQSIKDALSMMKEKISGNKLDVDPQTRAMFDYAESRGLLTFSEFEDVGKITQGKFARGYDKAADLNRKIGEQTTRPFVFFSFVRLLENSNLPKNEVFDTAYNLTQDAMVDYSARERPLMFKDLGVTGQLAGGLQTFMFSYVDQMAKWVKEARPKTLGGKGNPGPLIAGGLIALTYAGVQGLPFYQEADQLVQVLSDTFYGEKKTIGEIALSNAPDWARYGGMSAASGLNAQSRLSAADVLPNNVGEAITPYAGQIGKAGAALYEAATNPDELAARNLALSVAPSSVRGAIENNWATDEKNTYMNKRNEREYVRTPFDRGARYGNMTSLQEFKDRQGLYEIRTKEQADVDRKTELANKMTRGVKVKGQSFLASTDYAKLRQEYIERKGDPNQLDDIILKAWLDKNKTAKQRAEGIPSEDSLSSVYRYKYYNK